MGFTFRFVNLHIYTIVMKKYHNISFSWLIDFPTIHGLE